MTILRRPGSLICVHLPAEHYLPEDDRMRVWLKVPTQALYLEIEEIAKKAQSNFESARQIVGIMVDRIENVFLDDEKQKPFELDREKSGFLTLACAELINPYLDNIAGLIIEMPRLKDIDRKNS